MTRIKKPEPRSIKGICVQCGVNEQSHVGGGNFRALCLACHKLRFPKMGEYIKDYMAARRCDPNYVERAKVRGMEHSYTRFKKTFCEKCGFVAENRCQLDIDHIDGNKANGDESNLQTLCANCHRLKTHTNKEFKGRKKPTQEILPESVSYD